MRRPARQWPAATGRARTFSRSRMHSLVREVRPPFSPDAVVAESQAADSISARTPDAMEEKAKSQQRARVKQRIIGKPSHAAGH